MNKETFKLNEQLLIQESENNQVNIECDITKMKVEGNRFKFFKGRVISFV